MTLKTSTRFFNGALLAGALAMISTESAVAQPAAGTADSSVRLVQTWDKTFPRSDKVDHQKVTFKNRYGITLAADVYLPKDRGNKKLADFLRAARRGLSDFEFRSLASPVAFTYNRFHRGRQSRAEFTKAYRQTLSAQ